MKILQEFYRILQDTLQKVNKNYFLFFFCMARDVSARVGSKPVHFVLGTSGENTINQNGRKLIEFATEN